MESYDGKKYWEMVLNANLAGAVAVPYVREFQFDPVRKWRVDFAFVAIKLAVEVEGGIYKVKTRGGGVDDRGGRHRRPEGMIKDMEKYNALTLADWHLLRYWPGTVQDGTAATEIIAYVKKLSSITSYLN